MKIFCNKKVDIDMKTIYYCVVEEFEVPDNMTEAEIEERLNDLTKGKEYMWSENHDLLYGNSDC